MPDPELVGLLAHDVDSLASRRRRPARPAAGRTGGRTGPSEWSRSSAGFPSAIMRLRRGVEHDAAVGDRVDALELVRHDHERDAEAPRELADRLVEAGRGDRVQARRGLVQEEDPRVEGHRPGDRPPVSACRRTAPTASGARGREQPDLVELRRATRSFSLGAEVGELVERQAHVLEHVIEPKSAPLWYITPNLRRSAQTVLPLARRRCPRRRRGCAPRPADRGRSWP